MRRLEGLKLEMLATPDQQISLTDPDARSMAMSGRGSGVVGLVLPPPSSPRQCSAKRHRMAESERSVFRARARGRASATSEVIAAVNALLAELVALADEKGTLIWKASSVEITELPLS